MGELEQIFGAALEREEREMTVPQGTAAIEHPSAPETGDGKQDAVPTVPMKMLANFIMCAFRTARDYRRDSGVDSRLEYALTANRCRFGAAQLAALAKVGITGEVANCLRTAITFVKTRAAKSLMVDLISQSGEPLFDLSHSPLPDVPVDASVETMQSMTAQIEQMFAAFAQQGVTELPPDAEQLLMQAIAIATKDTYDEEANKKEGVARNRARRMKNKVWDMMEEGGFSKAVDEALSDLCLYGTCVIHGPVMRAVECNAVKVGRNGVPKYMRDVRLKPTFECVSPWDCYPAPDAKETDDGPFCMKVKYSAHDLWRLCDRGAAKERNGEGWNDAVVRDILERHPDGGVKLREFSDVMDASRRELENRGFDDTRDCTFEGVRCYAHVRGAMLAEMGIVKTRDGKAVKVNDFYRVEGVVIDDRVVYCRVLDDRMEFPISHASFYELPGSWWGESIADKLRLVQTMQDNVAKAMLLDLAATGPMMWVRNAGLLRDKGPDALTWRPYRTFAFDEPMFANGNSALPMGAIDVPSKARELITEWDMWVQQADNDSGIPRFAEGQSAGQSGALRTASGLAQFNEHMMRGMKMVLTSFDNGVILTTVRRTADWELIYGDDISLKGDVYVRPIGLIGRIMRVQRDSARMQLFNAIVSNQFLLQLIGPKGIMALLRPSLRDLDVNPDEILPSEQRVKFMETMEELKMRAAAMQGEQAVQGAEQAQGAPPGAEPPPQIEMPRGGVAERRAVA